MRLRSDARRHARCRTFWETGSDIWRVGGLVREGLLLPYAQDLPVVHSHCLDVDPRAGVELKVDECSIQLFF